MNNPSPRSHLYRLLGVLLIGLLAFLGIRALATPANWDYDNWHRADAVDDVAALPLIYGGNESCQACHEEVIDDMAEYEHRTLSCESCHGPFADHIKDGEKFADAVVDESQWQCLNCHGELISRPKDFTQFTKELVEKVRRHQELKPEDPCVECHAPHDPRA